MKGRAISGMARWMPWVIALPLAMTPSPTSAQELANSHLLHAALHVVAQGDWRHIDTAAGADDDLDIRRARVGLKGDAFRYVEYELVRDFRNTDSPWRDAYLNVAFRRELELRAGRFKVPFGAEELISVTDLDFVERALVSSYLAPARDVGAMVHGRAAGRRIRYHAGVFRSGGDNVRDPERRDRSGGPLLAARVVIRPWGESKAGDRLRGLSFGAALTTGRVPEGLYSLRGQTLSERVLFPTMLVSGQRRRIGGDIEWRRGPVTLYGEFIRVTDQRLGLAVDDGPLSDIDSRGWHMSGAWMVTGEDNDSRIRPERTFSRGGALEIAARVERLQVRALSTAVPIASPRSDAIVPEGTYAVTGGVNWYPIEWLKVQANVVREWMDRPRAAAEGVFRAWHPLARCQVAW